MVVFQKVSSSDGFFNRGLTIPLLRSRGKVPVVSERCGNEGFEDSKCNLKYFSDRSFSFVAPSNIRCLLLCEIPESVLFISLQFSTSVVFINHRSHQRFK